METLRETAKKWAELGLKIVPTTLSIGADGKKTADPKWKWQTKPYPGFEKLYWGDANAYAIKLGKLESGWLVCVDCDHDSGIDGYTNITKQFPKLTGTYIERTPHGFHFLFYTNKPVDAVNINHKTKFATELHVNGLIFMAPSKYEGGAYEEYQNSDLVYILDFYQKYQKLFGVEKKRVDVKLLLEGVPSGERNDAAIKLASYYRRRRFMDKNETRNQMVEWNKKNTPPLPHEELSGVIESAYSNVEPYHYFFVNEPKSNYSTDGSMDGEWWVRGSFEPVIFAEWLMQKYHIKTDRDDNTIFVYNPMTGIYTPTGEALIVEEMAYYLGEHNRNRYVADVKHHIKGSTYFNKPKTSSKTATLNGLLNIETGKITEYTHEEFVTIQIPIIYSPSIECPKTIAFIKEVVGEHYTPLIQEFVGYCLYPKYLFHKALMLVGSGENGKSTLINLIKNFLGAQNVSSLTLQELCSDRFAPAQLQNKLANLCADLPDKNLSRTGQFKMLTGGDPMSSAQKFKDYLHWTNRAKLMFSTNTVPESNDNTRAFYRRWEIVEFNNYYPPDKRDPHILEKICTPTEKSGLLNWALEGLKRLLEQGYFSNPKNYTQIRQKYIRKSNSARAFIKERLEATLDHNDVIEKDELYKKYVKWCRQQKLPSKRKGEFTQNMGQYLPEAEETQIRVKKKPKRAWKYVKFKQVSQVSHPLILIQKKENKKRNKGSRDSRDTSKMVLPEKSISEIVEEVFPSHEESKGNRKVASSSRRVCGDCKNWQTKNCVRERPDLVNQWNTSAETCEKFEVKE